MENTKASSKTKRIVKFLMLVLLILVCISIIAYLIPRRFLGKTEPGDIARIVVFNGNNGEETVITDPEVIEHIVSDIKDKSFKRTRLSVLRMGFTYRMSFYDKNEKIVERFTVNSDTVINGSVFSYEVKNGTLDFDYIAGKVS